MSGRLWGEVIPRLRLDAFGRGALVTFEPKELCARTLGWSAFLTPIAISLFEYAPTALLIGMAIFGGAFGWLAFGRSVLRISPAFYWLVALCIVAIAGAFWAPYPINIVRDVVKVVGYVVAAAIWLSFIRCVDDETRERAWGLLTAGSIIGLVIFSTTQLFAIVTDQVSIEHVRSTHKHSAYATMMAAWLLHRPAQKPFWLFVFLAIAYVLPVFAGVSQVAQLGALIVLGAMLLPEWWRDRIFIVITGLVIAAGLFSPLLAPWIFSLLDGSLLARPGIKETIGARLELWAVVAERVAHAPWFGYGANTMRDYPEMMAGMRYYQLPVISAHNNFVELWHDLGLTGLLLLTGFLIAVVRAVMHAPPDRRRLMQITFVICILMFSVDHRIWVSWFQGFLAIAAGMALAAPEQTSRRKL
jgi:O-antigen ligase